MEEDDKIRCFCIRISEGYGKLFNDELRCCNCFGTSYTCMVPINCRFGMMHDKSKSKPCECTKCNGDDYCESCFTLFYTIIEYEEPPYKAFPCSLDIVVVKKYPDVNIKNANKT